MKKKLLKLVEEIESKFSAMVVRSIQSLPPDLIWFDASLLTYSTTDIVQFLPPLNMYIAVLRMSFHENVIWKYMYNLNDNENRD